jgi:hypothetical protein
MRNIITAAFLAAIAVAASALPAASATGSHWYCTGDGIKSWTTGAATDASGWAYKGTDRTVYKDGGHCEKA